MDNKYTSDDLKRMQHFDLNRKVQIAQTRIIEWYQKNDGKVYVSFSGGKDSTVLLDLVRTVYPNVPAVFIDTGLEYPEIRNFVKTIDNVIWIRPKLTFRQVIEKYGYPLISKEVAQKIYQYRSKPDGCMAQRFDPNSEYNKKYKNRYSLAKWVSLRDSGIPISHMCCMVMKKNPAKQFEKESGLKPMVGTMACESQLRKTNWMKNGCNSFKTPRPISQPISIWTEQDILNYIRRFNIPYCSIYGDIVEDSAGRLDTTGCKRTGCVFCAFGSHLEKEPNRFQRLKITHPKLWDYCMKPWDNGGLGMKEVLEFLNIKTGE